MVNLETKREITETFELRVKPELKIILNNNEFEIIDFFKPNNSGICLFRQVESINLFVKTNYLIVINFKTLDFTLLLEP